MLNFYSLPFLYIPFRKTKEKLHLVSNTDYHNFNNSLFSSNLPLDLKNANITPICKKEDRPNIENYRPLSILPNQLKVYQRYIYIQIYEYLNKSLSKWQKGFYQGYSAQHCLLVMIEKWIKRLDKAGISGALLPDLSKTFDCVLHKFLIAKPAADGFDYNSANAAKLPLEQKAKNKS